MVEITDFMFDKVLSKEYQQLAEEGVIRDSALIGGFLTNFGFQCLLNVSSGETSLFLYRLSLELNLEQIRDSFNGLAFFLAENESLYPQLLQIIDDLEASAMLKHYLENHRQDDIQNILKRRNCEDCDDYSMEVPFQMLPN